jgi:hypothetical protein
MTEEQKIAFKKLIIAFENLGKGLKEAKEALSSSIKNIESVTEPRKK